MIQWEYIKISATILGKDDLNGYGNDGWELCGITSSPNYPYPCEYYFKRPIPETKQEP